MRLEETENRHICTHLHWTM